MAKLVIGTLDSIEATDAVIEDLEKAGFKRKEIFVTGPPLSAGSGTGTGAGAASGLAPMLKKQGVPSQDAGEFAEAVRRGKALISVRTEKEDRAEKAADIMARHHVGGPLTDRTEAGEIVAPVLEEELKSGKRVRVYTHVTEQPVEEDITLPEAEKEKLEKK